MEFASGLNVFDILKAVPEVEQETEEKRVCEKHGEYMCFVTKYKNGNVSETRCPECEKEINQKQEQERIKKELARIEEANRLYCTECNIRPEYFSKSLNDYIPKTEGQKKAKEAIENLIAEKKGKVILLGSNGVGKTMLSSLAVKGLGGKIYRMYDISCMIRQSYTTKATKSELEIVKELSELPLLAIDEVGRIANSEAVQNWFSAILDERHSRGLPFILTGNLHFKKDCPEGGCPKCFENYFDTDLLSRFHEDTSVIVIKAKDERKEKNSLSYFSD